MKQILSYLTIAITVLLCCQEKYIHDYPFDNDDFNKATDLTSRINIECFNTKFILKGTPDKNAGSCWEMISPSKNVWFKFKATDTQTISFTVSRFSSSDWLEPGSINSILLALWEEDGVTELACSEYVNLHDNVSIIYDGLTKDNWYYISLDSWYGIELGSFYICVKDTL